MRDLIDRQAAIEALWKALYEYEDETEKQFLESEELDVGEWIGHRIFVQNMNDIDRQTILNLPSAQPATNCSEIPNGSDDTISRQAAIDALDTIESEVADGYGYQYEKWRKYFCELPSAQPEQRWVPCSERLPKKNCRCLTTNEAWGSFEVDWNAWIDGQWLYPNEKPIAWMPMPEPYRGGDE